MKKVVNNWELELDQELIDFIDHEYVSKEIAPPKEALFRALELTSREAVNVVIFGQDPYPTKGVATGLAFSSNNTLPASLRNMFKELESDLGIKRVNPNLDDWAKQGVLLLNTALTVEIGKPGSHSQIGWLNVTKQVIAQINSFDRPVIFVLLGGHAKKLAKAIDQKHLIIECTHPSPLAAYRGFFDSKLFSKINDNLTLFGYPEIKF